MREEWIMSDIDSIKSKLIQKQRGYPADSLIDDILKGNEQLWTVKEIAQTIKVPVDSIHQWVKNGDPSYRAPRNAFHELAKIGSMMGSANFEQLEKSDEYIVFPSPDIYIGSLPRWTTTTLKNWLRTIKKADS